MENNKRFPVFNTFYNTIKIFEKKTKDKKKNDFVTLKLNELIKIRNELVKEHNKIENIVYSYKCNVEKNLLIKKEKIKKSNKLEKRLKKKNRRSRVLSKYPDLIAVIQCFDRKTREFSHRRNSFKRIKILKKVYSKKKIRFKVKTFNDQTKKLKDTAELFNMHTQFFLYDFPEISKNFNKIEYIKKY